MRWSVLTGNERRWKKPTGHKIFNYLQNRKLSKRHPSTGNHTPSGGDHTHLSQKRNRYSRNLTLEPCTFQLCRINMEMSIKSMT